MVLITEELVRKRSEHNECVISTLEELSLHQEDIEKFEHIQNWCRDLKILLLQSNLISRIENVHKMKNLEYLNLALNNVEVIENLEGCESLQKLDLTLNFIGDLLSVERLKANQHLQHLYLTGNPCTDYEGYREFVVATLPQLHTLDAKEIERSERIRAVQNYTLVRPKIIAQQLDYKKKREQQKKSAEEKCLNAAGDKATMDDSKFWEEISENTPETRIEIAHHSRRAKQKPEEVKNSTKREINLFNKDGKPNNINEAKLSFSFEDDEDRNCYVLTLGIYKHLDTSLLDVDVQPTYVTVRVKGKVFQITLEDEVQVSLSTAQRSQTTGHLVVTMPKVNGVVKMKPPVNPSTPSSTQTSGCDMSKRQYLEIGKPDDKMDFSKIFERSNKRKMKPLREKIEEKLPSKDFKDDPSVPPLE
ncbi:dynein axonemal assembly factor 11-like isoform X1 [Macrosteles quadrilineatus]|uniref:dynein axonemal assembly factor 11-like isoform X1 n=1 Tax=Macrosteles quadrilineatus TaxID=74068 RepID=UPI0023E0B94D|nr:dynein axonemal assembly factor 11-like isoform X1 [Macrosteles quadrilineatus]